MVINLARASLLLSTNRPTFAIIRPRVGAGSFAQPFCAFFAVLLGGRVANFVSPTINLLVISAIAFVAYFWVNYNLLPPHLDGHLGDEGEELESKVPLIGKEAMVLWGLGLGLMCALIPEGGSYDWSGILLQDHMDIGKGLNAAAATVFSLAMIASRLLGDKFFEMWGHVKTVQYGGIFGGGIWGLSLLIGIPLADSHQMASLVIVCINLELPASVWGHSFKPLS